MVNKLKAILTKQTGRAGEIASFREQRKQELEKYNVLIDKFDNLLGINYPLLCDTLEYIRNRFKTDSNLEEFLNSKSKKGTN